MIRSLRRSILKNQLKARGVEKINKRFHEFWMQLRLKQIRKQQKRGIYREDKDAHLIYWLKRRQGKGEAKRLRAIY